MIYGTQDLNAMERDAWRRGDYAMAEAIAARQDAEEAFAKLENDGYEDANAALRLAGAREDAMREAERAIQNLRNLLDSLPRMSRRKEVDAAVQAITDALTE